jgi:hypothetical protein
MSLRKTNGSNNQRQNIFNPKAIDVVSDNVRKNVDVTVSCVIFIIAVCRNTVY